MPHCLIEYSANIGPQADIPGLLRKVAAKFTDSGIFPVIGIRVRAMPVHEYVIADGKPDNAFAHATCVVAPGRPDELLQGFFGELFEVIRHHLSPLGVHRFLGLSLDVVVATETGSFKHNFG